MNKQAIIEEIEAMSDESLTHTRIVVQYPENGKTYLVDEAEKHFTASNGGTEGDASKEERRALAGGKHVHCTAATHSLSETQADSSPTTTQSDEEAFLKFCKERYNYTNPCLLGNVNFAFWQAACRHKDEQWKQKVRELLADINRHKTGIKSEYQQGWDDGLRHAYNLTRQRFGLEG